jgi:hypothetical protein
MPFLLAAHALRAVDVGILAHAEWLACEAAHKRVPFFEIFAADGSWIAIVPVAVGMRPPGAPRRRGALPGSILV